MELQHDFLDFALQLAKAAEQAIMPHYYQHSVSFKPDGTEVTIADRQAEIVIRQMIEERFPNHDILGEELEAKNTGAEYQWLLDPLDGTAWFTLGVPIFGSLIALLQEGRPILGVIHLPTIKETVYAAKNCGCWFQVGTSEPVRVQVQSSVSLSKAIVSASSVHGSNIYLRSTSVPYNLTALINQAGRFRFCGDCLQHALVC